MANQLVEIRNICKSFGGVKALNDVSFTISPGEIHALCGENGAGKSTLIKILSGSIQPDSGEILLAGTQLRTGSVHVAETAGIAVVHQEPIAFPHLNARDNIFVGREPRRWRGMLLDRRRMRIESGRLLDQLGESFPRHVPVGRLPLAQRQMVSFARALAHQCRMLILDEPTASLSQREADVLFRIVRELRSAGVSVIYVSHRLDEVFQLADRVTVLRDGGWIDTRATDALNHEQLIHLMVGRSVDHVSRTLRRDEPPPRVRLEVDQLSIEGQYQNVSFQLGVGEIVGLAGLVGAGRSEVARTIFGVQRADSGQIRIDGQRLQPGRPRVSMKRGIGLVPEDRQHQGLILPMTVRTNVCLCMLQDLSRYGWRSTDRERRVTHDVIEKLSVRAAGLEAKANTLSGGNQQKLVLGKWIPTSPRVLILDEPTRGVDVGAKAEIHRLIRQLADRGMAILLISSELAEILELSDRVLVMRQGSVVGEMASNQATQEKILALAIPASVLRDQHVRSERE